MYEHQPTHTVPYLFLYSILYRIWNMADLDQDGKLTLQEFAIANFLINSVQDSEGGSSQDLPDELPSDLLPPKPMGAAADSD